MSLVNSGFETGTNGATIATSDPGDPDSFDFVTVGVDGTLAYDNTRSMFGSLSMKFASGATAAGAHIRWDGKFGTTPVTDHYLRFYFYATAFPGQLMELCGVFSTASRAATLSIETGGKIRLADNAAAIMIQTVGTISLNQWIRIEARFVHSTTVGMGEVKLFNTASSSTPTETATSAVNKNTLASANRIRFGNGTNLANLGPFWVDGIQAGADAYPGPYVPPVATGSKNLLLMGVG